MTTPHIRVTQEPNVAALAPIALTTGLLMLIAALAAVGRIPGWATDYGTILIAISIIVYLSIAGRLLGWGIAQLLDRMSESRAETSHHHTVSRSSRPIGSSAAGRD